MPPARPRAVSAAADRARLPVVLLSGFLGSGKTTLLNGLLTHPAMADTAVAVNEFGDVALDQHLIRHGSDSTVVLANGCLCCNLAGDMEHAIMRVFHRRTTGELPSFARLVIEPSGLADIAPIAQAILRNPVMSRALRLDAIITTVDAQFGPSQLARHPENRKQVALADRLLITKTDLVTSADIAELRRLLREHNPVAPIIEARHGEIAPHDVLPGQFLSGDTPQEARRRGLFAAEPMPPDATSAHATVTDATTLIADRPLAWTALEAWLRQTRIAHGEQILRIKGIVDVAGAAGPLVLHGIHHVMPAPIELAAWPDADTRSRIVVISQALDRDALRQSWQDSLPAMIAAAPL
jgi:G3E family GTPase